MSITYFCPFCWAEGSTDLQVCPVCGKGLDSWRQTPYEERLLHSLNHPIPAQRMIAIQILGQLRFEPALPVFAHLVTTETDVYLLREIVFSLSLLCTDESRRLLERLNHHPSVVVRKACLTVSDTGKEELLP